MKHYLVTRYNVGLYSDNPYGVADPERWMRERQPLWERCRESVLSQNAEFEWWLCLDSNTPPDWLELILTDPRMVPCWDAVPDDLVFPDGWKLTTRLDCDDRLLPGALAELQKAVQQNIKANEECVWDYRYQIEGGPQDGHRPKRRQANSMFASLVNKDPTTSVYTGRGHTYLPELYRNCLINKVYAIKVEHGGNLYEKQGSNWA